MRRATTPTHIFEFEIDPATIDKIRIAYAQNGKVILIKTKDELTFTGNVGKGRLTQEETNLFNANEIVTIQVRVLTTGGDAIASDEFKVYCSEVLDDEVMV